MGGIHTYGAPTPYNHSSFPASSTEQVHNPGYHDSNNINNSGSSSTSYGQMYPGHGFGSSVGGGSNQAYPVHTGTSFGAHSFQNTPLTSQYSTSSFFSSPGHANSQGTRQSHAPRSHSISHQQHATNLPSSISSSYKTAVSFESTTPTATYPVPFTQSYGGGLHTIPPPLQTSGSTATPPIPIPQATGFFANNPASGEVGSNTSSSNSTNQFSAAKLAIARNNNKRSLLSSKLAQQASPLMQRPSVESADITMGEATPPSPTSHSQQSDVEADKHDDGQQHLDIANHPIPDVLMMLTALLQKIIDANDSLIDSNSHHHGSLEGSTPEPSGGGSGASSLSNLHGSGLPHRGPEDENNPVRTSLLAFHGRNVPAISLHAYLSRILKYCPTTNEVFISLLVYFDRIAHRINSNDVSLSQVAGSASPSVSGSEFHEHSGSEISGQQKLPLFVIDSFNIHRLIIAGVTVASKFFSDIFYKNSRYAKVGGLPLDELNHLELQFLILTEFELMISLDEMQRYADLLLRFWQKQEMSQQQLPPIEQSSSVDH